MILQQIFSENYDMFKIAVLTNEFSPYLLQLKRLHFQQLKKVGFAQFRNIKNGYFAKLFFMEFFSSYNIADYTSSIRKSYFQLTDF